MSEPKLDFVYIHDFGEQLSASEEPTSHRFESTTPRLCSPDPEHQRGRRKTGGKETVSSFLFLRYRENITWDASGDKAE